jgi:ATP synthase protein I
MADVDRRPAGEDATLAAEVGDSARRKLKARRLGAPAVWSGLAVMGAIGWSIAVPTLLGAALGIWLDRKYPGAHSWTLALLVAGLVLGCFSAWHWVSAEDKTMRDEQAGGDV